jgi:hypothetical protein
MKGDKCHVQPWPAMGPGKTLYIECCYCDKGDSCKDPEAEEWRGYQRREDEEAQAMHEHYHPKFESEDDMIINAECDRKGIPRP